MPRAKKPEPPRRIRIRKDDLVKVIAGRDKGKSGRVISVNRKTGRLIVEGINMVKRHMRANRAKAVKGGIAERESGIHVSNVMLLTPGGVPTRIGFRVETVGGKTRRVRIARKTGETVDKKG